MIEYPRHSLYLEGTDASGKDSVARELQLLLPDVGVAAGYFYPDYRARAQEWQHRCPEAGRDVIFLASVVGDLLALKESDPRLSPHIQVSHGVIRGAAYQDAFDLPTANLFNKVSGLLPHNIQPIALSAQLKTIQQRVLNNPESTEFDFLVFNEPARVQRIIDGIAQRSVALGGRVIDTSNLTPNEVAHAILEEPDTYTPRRSAIDAQEILDEIAGRYPMSMPIIQEIREGMVYDV